MRRIEQTLVGLLLCVKHRPAGSFTDRDGREVVYDAAEQVLLLPYGDEKGFIKKLSIAEESVKEIYAQTDDLHWGALVSLKLHNNEVTGLIVHSDTYAQNLALELEI